MKNFKMQLDQEIGPKRFDAAMQARITRHIAKAKPTARKDLRYVLSMVGAAILLAVLLMMTFTASYHAPLATAAFDDPLKDVYINTEETEHFEATTSLFDFETKHVRNQTDVQQVEKLINDAHQTSVSVDIQQYGHVDFIVRYKNGDTRAIQFYDDLEGRYWLYDLSTENVYEGTYNSDDYQDSALLFDVWKIGQSPIWLTLMIIVALGFVVHVISKKMTTRLGIPYIEGRYLFKRQRYLSAIVTALTFIIIIWTDSNNLLFFFCAVLIPFFINSYYEYRYAREDRQYISDTITTVLMIIAFLIVIYVQSYF